MKQMKKTETTSESEPVGPTSLPVPPKAINQQITSNAKKKPVDSPAFPKPPRTPPFAQGFKIRQDGKNRFFSRARRGSI